MLLFFMLIRVLFTCCPCIIKSCLAVVPVEAHLLSASLPDTMADKNY